MPMEHTTYVYMLLFGGLLLLSRLLENISEKNKTPGHVAHSHHGNAFA